MQDFVYIYMHYLIYMHKIINDPENLRSINRMYTNGISKYTTAARCAIFAKLQVLLW